MREIKYRAWDLIKSEMRHVSFLEFDAAGELCNVALAEPGRTTKQGYVARFEERENGEDLRLMQFIGLKDKNGKEIYEGDVVRVSYDGSLEFAGSDAEVREVKWGAEETGDNFFPAFDLKGNEMEVNGLSCALNNGEIEIIGNIYENADLLTV